MLNDHSVSEPILERLGKEAWVRGSMIVSDEGMVVLDSIAPDLDRDAVAALASDLVTEASVGLQDSGMQRRPMEIPVKLCPNPVMKVS